MKLYVYLTNTTDYVTGFIPMFHFSDFGGLHEPDGIKDYTLIQTLEIDDVKVPPASSLVDQAVSTCEAAIAKIEKDASEKIGQLRDKMQELKALEYSGE